MCLFAPEFFLNGRPGWISFVNQLLGLTLGLSFKSCLLICRWIEIFGPYSRVDRIYGLI